MSQDSQPITIFFTELKSLIEKQAMEMIVFLEDELIIYIYIMKNGIHMITNTKMESEKHI